MLTDTALRPTHAAASFALRAAAWGLGLFGLLRLPWVEAHIVLPLTLGQGAAAAALFGVRSPIVEVTLACSGTDALAMCLGAVLAYPVRWRSRFAGAAGGTVLILGLNTLRIGTLGLAASTAWFNALHLYIWPALLTLAIAGYAFWWMSLADRGPGDVERTPDSTPAPPAWRPVPTRRFIVLTTVFVVVFAAASPLYLESASVAALAGVIARSAARILGIVGVSAYATDNVLWTARGGFLVTQECVSTPLIPVYLAAVCCAGTWRRIAAGLLAAVPLFGALGIVRLLVVALPAAVGQPLFFVHAFYQLLLGTTVVLLAAWLRHRGTAAAGHAVAGIAVGALFIIVAGPLYTRAVIYPLGAPLEDPQGAIALLPAFQAGLYMALWVAASGAASWMRFLAGFAALGATQVAGLLALHLLSVTASLPHVRDVRGWAVAGPVLILAAVVHARPRR